MIKQQRADNEINTRKHMLESLEQREPGRDFTAEWMELAEQYLSLESRANYAYCLSRVAFYARKNEPPPVAEEGYDFEWQERKDVE